MLFSRIKSLDEIIAAAGHKPLHRSLNAFQLTMLGIGAIIGTGIFVLTAEAAQKAGPGMMVSFVIAALVCGVAALCYAEMAAMAPVSGSAYTYSYAVFGEVMAWMVGWALILEYAVSGSAVAVGWSGYFVGLVRNVGLDIPPALANGPYAGGVVNLPAVVISALVTGLLILGTRESARLNALLVALKIIALLVFIAATIGVVTLDNFHPFTPRGWGPSGVTGAAASIFFAYVGFDAVSTAAEESHNPQRNLPLSLVASLGVCTLLYLLVAACTIGTIGAQPLAGPGGALLAPGSADLARQCAQAASAPLVCSNEALAHVLRVVGHPRLASLIGLVAFLALPSVILTMIFGQTRLFFVMARDGLLPKALTRIHGRWNTPHVVTAITGAGVTFAAAFLPVGQLADISNSGTLFAFVMVAIAVLRLRLTEAGRHRPFRTPAVWIVAPLAIAGCVVLFLSLPLAAMLVLPVWGALGLIVYLSYSRRMSHMNPALRLADAAAAPLGD